MKVRPMCLHTYLVIWAGEVSNFCTMVLLIVRKVACTENGPGSGGPWNTYLLKHVLTYLPLACSLFAREISSSWATAPSRSSGSRGLPIVADKPSDPMGHDRMVFISC